MTGADYRADGLGPYSAQSRPQSRAGRDPASARGRPDRDAALSDAGRPRPLCRRAGSARCRVVDCSGEGRRRTCGGQLRSAASGWCMPPTLWCQGRLSSGIPPPAIRASTSRLATRRPRRRLSPAPRALCGSTPGSQRVTGVPMEPRTNVAEYDAASGRYTLHTGTGRGVAGLRDDLAAQSGCHRSAYGSSAVTWAAISGRGTSFIPNTRCCRARATHRSGGEMDLRTQRRFPQRLSGSRPDRDGRAGARRKREVSRCAGEQSQQSRRPCSRVRLIAKGMG